MTSLLTIGALLFLALPLYAQEQPDIHQTGVFDVAPYAAVLVGNIADLRTTNAAFQRGCHEGNGFTSTNRIGPIAVAKISFMAGVMLAMRALETHGHPKWARVLGYVDGGATMAAAWHNQRC